MIGVRGKLLIGLLGATAPAALAGTISDVVLRIQATNAQGTGSVDVMYNAQNYNRTTDTYNWEAAEPMSIMNSSGQVIATLAEASEMIIGDPVINLNFLVIAGNADTTFTITSALLSFPAMPGAVATASAQIGSTDLDGNGVTVTGQYAGNTKGYRADYNGLVPGGTNFAELVDNQAGAAFTSNIRSETRPQAGIGNVVDMSSQFQFTVSANDQASGTSIYVVTPEPASLALLALGGLVALRRRS
jgi:hypothetical protein